MGARWWKWCTGPLPVPTSKAPASRRAPCNHGFTVRKDSSQSPSLACAVAIAEDREQPVPWLFMVSIRSPGTTTTSWASSPAVLTSASGHSPPSRCPPLTSTVVPAWAARRFPWASAASQSPASGSSRSIASSARLGVTRSARGRSSRSAASAASCRSLSPLVATITGSRTTTAGRAFPSQLRTAAITAESPSMPILTASMLMSSLMASSWAVRKSAGGT
ncbi:hypothetical protein D9M72_462080 [compost metagenome]